MMSSMKTGVLRDAAFRLVALALAIGTVSDGRTGRIAYAQGVTDPTVVKARAAINRGRYSEAEGLLKPLASGEPEGEAALELGLFYEMMGRRDDARAILRRISDTQVGARTSPAAYARLGRAARALGEFQLANDAYRIATEKAPNDPALHTGWGELFLQVHDNAEAAKSFQDAL
jgi:Flp pilus assembly protein TadD